MTWFVCVGRRWGDDEATPLVIAAKDKDEARGLFIKSMDTPWADKTPTGFAPGDGPGTVWCDSIFDCGDHEPKEVS
jgi:hypothetical protein